jgi:hypothetical protein
MAKTKPVRANRKERKLAVAVAEKMNNPYLTFKEVGEKFGINEGTLRDLTRRAGYKLAAKQSVADVIEKNNLLVGMADSVIAERLLSGDEGVRTADLISLRDSAFKQNQLLGGKPTELIGIKAIIEQIQNANS